MGQNYSMSSGPMPQAAPMPIQRMPSQGSLGMGGGGNMPMGPPMGGGMGGPNMGNSGMGGMQPPMQQMNPAYGQQQYMMNDQR